jgi:hypothetical protein
MAPADQYLPYTRKRHRTSTRAERRVRRGLAKVGGLLLGAANRPPNQTAVIVGVAVALVVAALTVPTSLVAPTPPPPAGWSTFDTANRMLAPVVAATPGGPWSISLAEGVAAAGPWSPTLSMWGLNASWAPTITACQSLLSGASLFTFWNDSDYPAAAGAAVFESGGAGLWTFVYLNPSHGALVASVLDDRAYTNGVLPPNSPCANFGGPFRSPTSYLNPANVTDPSSFAENSYRDITFGQPVGEGPSTAFYILGNPALPVSFVAPGYNQEWSTYYGTCGAPGVQGNVIYAGAPQDIPHHPGYQQQITVRNFCYGSLDGILPGAKSFWNFGNTFYASWPISVLTDTSARPVTSTGPLTTSMFSMSVLLASGLGPYSFNFTSGQPTCAVGTNSLPACVGVAQTWFAVLLNPSGTIIDTFPSISGASTWTVPDVAISSNDQIVLVSPVPVFSLSNSGLEFDSGWSPYVCCGFHFGTSTVPNTGTYTL